MAVAGRATSCAAHASKSSSQAQAGWPAQLQSAAWLRENGIGDTVPTIILPILESRSARSELCAIGGCSVFTSDCLATRFLESAVGTAGLPLCVQTRSQGVVLTFVVQIFENSKKPTLRSSSCFAVFLCCRNRACASRSRTLAILCFGNCQIFKSCVHIPRLRWCTSTCVSSARLRESLILYCLGTSQSFRESPRRARQCEDDARAPAAGTFIWQGAMRQAPGSRPELRSTRAV